MGLLEIEIEIGTEMLEVGRLGKTTQSGPIEVPLPFSQYESPEGIGMAMGMLELLVTGLTGVDDTAGEEYDEGKVGIAGDELGEANDELDRDAGVELEVAFGGGTELAGGLQSKPMLWIPISQSPSDP